MEYTNEVHQTKIGNVCVDDTYYSGKDQYSDGVVEDELLRIVQSGDDKIRAMSKTNQFPIYYHLAKEREFVTEPMQLSKKDSVLEIGAGCGAISGALAARAHHVDCVELSKKRATINAYKNRDKGNMTIYVGNFCDIRLDGKYDVITLIGVLEYANYYIATDDPYTDLLKMVREYLKSGGRIYIAIENRLGAKYFSGCKEDHSGKAFEGIMGYPSFAYAKTFSYYELLELFHQSGLEPLEFYYPYPDYKFPHCIYTDDCLPQQGDVLELAGNYTSMRRKYFDETRFLKSLRPEEYRLFANSYLICARIEL